MKQKYRSAITISATVLLLWAVFSWPLPRYFSSGVPQSDHNIEKGHVRHMIPGDQLQLMYHFWLAGDMMAGKTPLFSNVYEFNRGDDEELKRPDPYYLPYSLIFSFFTTFLSRAAAWNLAGLLSIFVTFFSTYWLALRLTNERLPALTAALLASTFPYRWITLLIGSPTGFGISLVPLTALGLHMAVKDGKWTGGLLAGSAVFLSYCSDLHVVYFNMLTLPFWTIAFMILDDDFKLSTPKTWKKPAIGLMPAVFLTAITALTASLAGSHLQKTDMMDGRPEKLVAKYSARSRGLFSWDNLGMDNHVFLGHIAVLIILIALIVILIAAFRKRMSARQLIFFSLVFVGSLCVVSLALGSNGLWDGWMLWTSRKFVPKYKMIRQAVKIYCLMPLFFSVLAAMGMKQFLSIVPSRRHPRFWVAVLAFLCVAEWRFQINPSICLLAHDEPAYAAVRADAEAQGNDKPRAIVIPLWPGDSHWSSLYEHYVSLYRIRMLNGYSPAIGNEYYNSVIMPLDTMNRGVVSEEQLSLLKNMDTDYLIFHQDAYPDQVSPYPASQALFRFLAHPHLELIKQSESIWAFKILDSPVHKEPISLPEYMVSMRGWEMESASILGNYGEVLPAERASGPVLKLTAGHAEMQSRPFPAAPGQQLNLRLRGHGAFTWEVKTDDLVAGTRRVEVASDEWVWETIYFDSDMEHFVPTICFSKPQGDIYLDMMFLSAGRQVSPKPGEEITIPAGSLYSQGYLKLDDHSIVLRKDKDQDLEILYGMFPLLEKGTYQVELDIECEEAVEPGSLIYLAHTTHPFIVPIEKPGPFVHIYKHPDNFPVKIGFEYSRNADVKVNHLKIKRLQ